MRTLIPTDVEVVGGYGPSGKESLGIRCVDPETQERVIALVGDFADGRALAASIIEAIVRAESEYQKGPPQ